MEYPFNKISDEYKPLIIILILQIVITSLFVILGEEAYYYNLTIAYISALISLFYRVIELNKLWFYTSKGIQLLLIITALFLVLYLNDNLPNKYYAINVISVYMISTVMIFRLKKDI